MKRLRTALTAAALVVGTAVAAQAQNPQPQGQAPGGGMGRPSMTQMLFKDIVLTPDQQTKVEAIQAKYREQMMAVRSEMQNGDRDAARAKMRDLMSKQNDEIKTVLTDDQRKQYDANLKEMEARRQQMMQGGGGRPPAI